MAEARQYEFKQKKTKEDTCGECLWLWPDIRPGSETAGQMMCFREDGCGRWHMLRDGGMAACGREGFEPRPRVYDVRAFGVRGKKKGKGR